MTFDEMRRRLRARLGGLPPAPLAELLDVLMLPDFDWARPDRFLLRDLKTRTFAELLIDLRGGPDLAGRARRHAEAGR